MSTVDDNGLLPKPYAASTKYQNEATTLLLPSTKLGPLRFFFQVPNWGPYASSSKYQNGTPTLLLPSNRMGSLRGFYQVPNWGPYASSSKYQIGVPTLLLPSAKLGCLRFFFQVPNWGPYASSSKYQNGASTLLLPSNRMGSLRDFYQVPNWGLYASSSKYQTGASTLLLPSTKMVPLRFFYQVPKWGPYAVSTKWHSVRRHSQQAVAVSSDSSSSPTKQASILQGVTSSHSVVTLNSMFRRFDLPGQAVLEKPDFLASNVTKLSPYETSGTAGATSYRHAREERPFVKKWVTICTDLPQTNSDSRSTELTVRSALLAELTVCAVTPCSQQFRINRGGGGGVQEETERT